MGAAPERDPWRGYGSSEGQAQRREAERAAYKMGVAGHASCLWSSCRLWTSSEPRKSSEWSSAFAPLTVVE